MFGVNYSFRSGLSGISIVADHGGLIRELAFPFTIVGYLSNLIDRHQLKPLPSV